MLFGGKKKRRIERLLIVEDEPLVAFDNEHFLTQEGFEIAGTVDSVADALALIAEAEEIDLLLVDVALSDGSGVEVAQAAHGRGIAVMFVTGNCPGEAKDFAAGCLAKPYAQRDLLAAIDAVEAAIEGRKAPRKLPAGFSLFGKVG
ncbi:response regulator [Sphingomonas soli]|uniref:response regulator n=1 Tax=Sphingomonas soli TaxID=266127 RepID=UPI00082CA49C|nr:response regulator [Sphingomonas soli]